MFPNTEKPEEPKAEPMKEQAGPAVAQPAAPEQGENADAGEYQKGEAANMEADKATKELDQKVKAIEGELDKTLQDQQKETVNKY